MCVRERETERDRETERERQRQRERKRESVCAACYFCSYVCSFERRYNVLRLAQTHYASAGLELLILPAPPVNC